MSSDDPNAQYETPDNVDKPLDLTAPLPASSPPDDPSMGKAQETVNREFDGNNEIVISGVDRPGIGALELAKSLDDGKLQQPDDRASFANAMRQAFREGGPDKVRQLMQQTNEKLHDLGSPQRLISGSGPLTSKEGNFHSFRLYNDQTGAISDIPGVEMKSGPEKMTSDYAREAAAVLADGALTEPERKQVKDALYRSYQDGGVPGHNQMVFDINNQLKKSESPHRLSARVCSVENQPDAINPQMSRAELINTQTGLCQNIGSFHVGPRFRLR